jgi:hypothetical protein
MKSLLEFYNNSELKNNVHEYLIEFLKEEGVKRIFDKEDVSSLADAKEVIDKAFQNLENMFEKKPKKKEKINEAR